MESHLSAGISMVGMALDGIGGLYLAYDLLGGEYHALSTLTRVANYSVLVGVAYGVPLGAHFGIVAGLGLGTAMALQLSRAARNEPDKELLFVLFIGLLRALGLGIAVANVTNGRIGMFTGIATFCVSTILQRSGFGPARIYEAAEKPHFGWRKLAFAGSVALLATVIGAGAALMTGHTQLGWLAAKIGFVIAFGLSVITSVSPMIEYYSEKMPPKTLGIVGAVMLVLGFGIQAMPNLATLLDLPY